ncbi:hypothetical protein H5410_059441 [Solanum commersonii]|uniref:Uncharacterized protein n=1 Tax=Solanum commersonii TaxID=4109 RepID=A0A9J5W2D6_SOLCO|nr:hypothetical protein H5410_059441 [Solanum commersonii]
METGKGGCHLGSSGALYFALNIRFVPTIIKYVGNVANTVLQCLKDFGLEGYNWFEMTSIAIHPTVPHMFYLSFLGKIISYNFEMDVAQLVYNFTGCRPTQYFKFFPYEWHQ